MAHTCIRCRNYALTRAELKNEIQHHLRTMARNPGTPVAKSAKTKIGKVKAQIESMERWQNEHLADAPDTPEKPRRILDVRKKAAPKPPKPPRKVIDQDALTAANEALAQLAVAVIEKRPIAGGNNTLPATGRCHECDRAISGERRFCGRCMSKRNV